MKQDADIIGEEERRSKASSRAASAGEDKPCELCTSFDEGVHGGTIGKDVRTGNASPELLAEDDAPEACEVAPNPKGPSLGLKA